MNQTDGYLGDIRQFGPSYDAYLMRVEAQRFSEVDADSLDAETMEEIVKTAGLLMGIIAVKGRN